MIQRGTPYDETLESKFLLLPQNSCHHCQDGAFQEKWAVGHFDPLVQMKPPKGLFEAEGASRSRFARDNNKNFELISILAHQQRRQERVSSSFLLLPGCSELFSPRYDRGQFSQPHPLQKKGKEKAMGDKQGQTDFLDNPIPDRRVHSDPSGSWASKGESTRWFMGWETRSTKTLGFFPGSSSPFTMGKKRGSVALQVCLHQPVCPSSKAKWHSSDRPPGRRCRPTLLSCDSRPPILSEDGCPRGSRDSLFRNRQRKGPTVSFPRAFRPNDARA